MLQSSERTTSLSTKMLLGMVMVAPCFFIRFSLDNDVYWLIASGRHVINHGIPVTDPLSLHTGLDFVMQQWLSAVSFAFVYDNFGVIGMILMVVATYIAIALLVNRLCLLMCGNEFISYVVTILTVVVLWPFMTTRPFLISLLFFVMAIYILERTVAKKNSAWLIAIPLLSIVLVNFHAALWPFLFIIGIPYLLDSIRFKFLFFQGEGYPRLTIMTAFACAFLAGFANPYGIKAMTYLFRSYGHKNISANVLEMQSPNFQTGAGIFVFCVLFLVVLVISTAKPPKLKLRYGLLLIGTGFMALTSLRNLSLFAVCGMPMLAFTLRETVPRVGMAKKVPAKIQIFMLLSYLAIILAFFGFNLGNAKETQYEGLPREAVAYIQQTYQKDDAMRLFAGYNLGGYAEFMGLKPFIDARAEVFLKVNNGKADILDDLLAVDSGTLHYKDFIKKYQLNVFLVEQGELLDIYLARDPHYVLAFQQEGFAVYAAKDE